MRPAFGFLFALALALPLAATDKHHEKVHVEIKQWQVPYPDSHPGDPYSIRPDAIWFAGQKGNYLAALNPQTGVFRKIDLIDEPAPQSVIVATNGLVWYAATLRGYIGRYDPKSRTLSRIPMSNSAAGDPNQLVFEPGERNIWFTVKAGNIVGRLRIESWTVDLIGVPTPDARPDGIAMASDGSPWIALSGTNKLATVDPGKFTLRERALPRAGARPGRVAFTTDGRLWYIDSAEGYLGALVPATDEVKEWRLPGGKNSQPYAMAVDSQDRIWCIETGRQPNRLVGFDPKKQRFFSATALPPSGGPIRNMHYVRDAGQLWFGTDANALAYAKIN